MCLSDPVLALAALDISIRDSWSEEELVRFLAERKAEDPLPQNILVGLDFSLVDPRDFTTGDVWYMKWSDDHHPNDCSEDGIIRKAKNGYWKSVDSSRIPTSTAIIGMKMILEFYEGQALCGTRTGWVMHEYQVEHNDEANLPQDYKSLCKVFLKGEKRVSDESQQDSSNADSPKDSFEAYLQYLAKIEEPRQTVNADEQDISCSKGQNEQDTQCTADGIDVHDVLATEDYIELNDLLSDDTAVGNDALTLEDLDDLLIPQPQASAPTSTNSSKQPFAVQNTLATEDYIELNDLLFDDTAVGNDALTLEDLDGLLIPQASAPSSTKSSKQSFVVHDALEDHDDLLTPEASASTSANSSKRSMFSEECFDSDALLREILKDRNLTEGENKDHKFSIVAPTNLVSVVISPSEQVLDDNAMVAGTLQQGQLPGDDRDEHSRSGFKQQSPSNSACFPIRSDSSQSSTKSRRERSPSKFGKIMKKYACFRSL